MRRWRYDTLIQCKVSVRLVEVSTYCPFKIIAQTLMCKRQASKVRGVLTSVRCCVRTLAQRIFTFITLNVLKHFSLSPTGNLHQELSCRKHKQRENGQKLGGLEVWLRPNGSGSSSALPPTSRFLIKTGTVAIT